AERRRTRYSRRGSRSRDLAYCDLRQTADRRDQWARLWRRCIAELDPRSADRLRALGVSFLGGKLWPGQFQLVIAAAGRPAESQGAALHRTDRHFRGGGAHRASQSGRPRGAPARYLHRDRADDRQERRAHGDRKSTRLNSSHVKISYAVFCLKKKKKKK